MKQLLGVNLTANIYLQKAVEDHQPNLIITSSDKPATTTVTATPMQKEVELEVPLDNWRCYDRQPKTWWIS